MINMENNDLRQIACVQITCKDGEGHQFYGTGTCFRTEDPSYDLVLTAGHCIPNLQPESITIRECALTVVSVFRPEKYQKASIWDFSVIIIQKLPSEISAFTLSTDFTLATDAIYSLCGYPAEKHETENQYNVFKANYINETDSHQLIFKLVDSTCSAEHSEKELLEGMSGGPIVYNSEIPVVCGIFTHTLRPDGAYHETCFVSIKHIIDWMRQADLIYLKERNPESFCIFEPMMKEDLKQAKGKACISAILIGKSGAGKSAFAKTFMKNAMMFDATGQTRTTRSTIKYRTSLYCRTPIVSIHFFNKEDFVTFRLKRCYEILGANYSDKLETYAEESDDDIESHKALSSYSLKLSDLSKCVLANDAFFDYRELSYLNDNIETNIIRYFKTIFSNYEVGLLPKTYTSVLYH